MKGRVLIIAGSDSSGGAGVQADIKTVTALGGYATTAITSLTAQDTNEIHEIHDVPIDFIRLQIKTAIEDIGVDAIKTGMLANVDVVKAVAAEIADAAETTPLIVDPVMKSKGGSTLLADGGAGGMKAELVRMCTVFTPNIPEAEALSGVEIRSSEDMTHAAEMLMTLGPKAVLLKGGHLEGDQLMDILISDEGEYVYASERIDTANTHGTGCTLASAIAVGMAQGMTLREAVERARDYVRRAIETAPGYGSGHGPLNHVDAALR